MRESVEKGAVPDDVEEEGWEAISALWLFTDGASRGNPGPAGIGVVVAIPPGTVVEEAGESIGRATNNVAEYKALLLGLDLAAKYDPTHLTIHSDSELMVLQLKGSYQVRARNLTPLYMQAREKMERFPQVDVVHVPRGWNFQADRLATTAAQAGEREAARKQSERITGKQPKVRST